MEKCDRKNVSRIAKDLIAIGPVSSFNVGGAREVLEGMERYSGFFGEERISDYRNQIAGVMRNYKPGHTGGLRM